jgi:hypothetical protein
MLGIKLVCVVRAGNGFVDGQRTSSYCSQSGQSFLRGRRKAVRVRMSGVQQSVDIGSGKSAQDDDVPTTSSCKSYKFLLSLYILSTNRVYRIPM